MPKNKTNLFQEADEFGNTYAYTLPTTPDTATQDSERIQEQMRQRDNELQEKLNRYQELTQQRIALTPNREIHTINTIIEWAKAGKKTIKYRAFNYHLWEGELFYSLLNELRNTGAFSNWQKNPYQDAFNAEFIFDDINISILMDLRIQKQNVIFSPNQTFKYENHILWFKLSDHSFDSIDFSNSIILRQVFESFWTLFNFTSNHKFTKQEVISKYKELFDEDITDYFLAKTVGNIRNKKIKKNLSERFKIYFDKAELKWIFLIS